MWSHACTAALVGTEVRQIQHVVLAVLPVRLAGAATHQEVPLLQTA
jgi:hypothetical protein